MTHPQHNRHVSAWIAEKQRRRAVAPPQHDEHVRVWRSRAWRCIGPLGRERLHAADYADYVGLGGSALTGFYAKKERRG